MTDHVVYLCPACENMDTSEPGDSPPCSADCGGVMYELDKLLLLCVKAVALDSMSDYGFPADESRVRALEAKVEHLEAHIGTAEKVET